MVMIPKNDKAQKIKKAVMSQKGVSAPKATPVPKDLLKGPYLQH